MTNFCSESRSPDQDPNTALPNTNQQRQALDRDNKEKYLSTEQVQHVSSTKAAFYILYTSICCTNLFRYKSAVTELIQLPSGKPYLFIYGSFTNAVGI